MHREPHLRIQRVFEDADEDGEMFASEPELEDVDDEGKPVMVGPWYCGCGQSNEGAATECVWCGTDREEG